MYIVIDHSPAGFSVCVGTFKSWKQAQDWGEANSKDGYTVMALLDKIEWAKAKAIVKHERISR